MNVLQKLRKTASNALTYVKDKGAKFAAKTSACAAVVGSCVYGAFAMAQDTSAWPTADTVLSGLKNELGPWVSTGLTIAAAVLVLKLGYNQVRSFLFRS